MDIKNKENLQEAGIDSNSNKSNHIISKIKNKDSFFWWIVLFLVLLCLTVLVFIVNGNTWATQVLAACLGAIITIIATRLLLSSQSKIERNLELYNTKLKVYSDFVSKMYEILRDDEIEQKEIKDLRTRLFGQVGFYASGEMLDNIDTVLQNANHEEIQNMQLKFARIAGILQKDLRENRPRKNKPIDYKSFNRLWSTFEGILDTFNNDKKTNIVELADERKGTSNYETPTDDDTNFLNNGFWHFAMWGAEQIEALKEGKRELNLIEYDEEWRTNQIKKIKNNDLIFLFRSGGLGYMGVFRAIGWRVFEFGENDYCRETLNIFGKPQEVFDTNTDKERIEKDLKQSDIYESREDGATLCSSVIVEPLVFSASGIQNPGGVYRRTISSYDRGYGIKQLERFMTVLNDENSYNSMVAMNCNIDLFKRILSSGEIQPAPRDDKGNWLN